METECRDNVSLVDEDASFDTLQDMERQTSDDLRQGRAHERFSIKSKVILQPGNSSEFLSFKVQGIIGDISAGGCNAMFPVPIQVGDIYRLHFNKEQLDLPISFVRCLRCRLISEDAFQAGFAFFKPITLPQNLLNKQKHDS